MDLTNQSYVTRISARNVTESYHRESGGWMNVSVRGREFRATAKRVLHHVLPALGGIKANVLITVEDHRANA